MATPEDYQRLDDAEMLRVYRAGNRTPGVMADLRRRGLHAEIGDERPAAWTASTSPPPLSSPPSQPFQFRPTASERKAQEPASDHRGLLTTSGLLLFVVGIYFVVFDPGTSGTDVVNLQKLTMGGSFVISGAVLFAAGMRPGR